MRLWIDSDIGDNPDDAVALWCAARSDDTDLVGISTVGGDVTGRAVLARTLVRDVNVVAGPPAPALLHDVDVLLGIGPWTHIADLADAGALPLRVVLMGGVLGSVEHRGAIQAIEHNVGSDPDSAARLLRTIGNLIVVPLDSTARVHAHPADERAYEHAIPGFRDQLAAWRVTHGPLPLVLHDPAALLIAVGEKVARMESRRLRVEPDGMMFASVDGPLQHVVAHVNADATRARIRALVAMNQGD